MPDSKPVKIADALATAITAAASTFSITSFTCQRDWKPVLDLKDLATLQLRVIPGPTDLEPLARRYSRGEVAIVVTIQKQATTKAEADELDYFAEEISDFIGTNESSAAQAPENAFYRGHEITDADTIGGRELPQFSKVLRIRYQYFS